MKKFLVWLLIGGSVMILGPKGMELGSYNDQGQFMTIGPGGMKIGNVDKQGNLFQLGKDGMSLGKVGKDSEWGLKSIRPKPFTAFGGNEDD